MTYPPEYTYLGDRHTSTAFKGQPCSAVRRPDGKCIRGRNGSMLVCFWGVNVVVLARLLRKRQCKTFFEVYPKRVLLDINSLDDLPLLDRNDTLQPSKNSARSWGGVVVKVEAQVLNSYPLVRSVLTWEVIWVHKPKLRRRPVVKLRTLMGKLRANDCSLYKKWDR